jgi:hypothetical protein
MTLFVLGWIIGMACGVNLAVLIVKHRGLFKPE